jgi:hypothetical protein
MAFARVWSDNRPAGTVLASLIDDEIQYARVDVRERIAVEHTFPSTDDTTTGRHAVGSARIFVDTDANKDTNLAGTDRPTGTRVGGIQYSTDTEQFEIRTADGTTSAGPAKKRFKVMNILLWQNIQSYEIAATTGEAQLTAIQSGSLIDFSLLTGQASNSKLQSRLIVMGRNQSSAGTTQDHTFRARANSVINVWPPADPTSGTLLGEAILPDDGASHIIASDWTTITLITSYLIYATQLGTSGQTSYLDRLELQFRIAE